MFRARSDKSWSLTDLFILYGDESRRSYLMCSRPITILSKLIWFAFGEIKPLQGTYVPPLSLATPVLPKFSGWGILAGMKLEVGGQEIQ
jgi:hypothetical protein